MCYGGIFCVFCTDTRTLVLLLLKLLKLSTSTARTCSVSFERRRRSTRLVSLIPPYMVGDETCYIGGQIKGVVRRGPIFFVQCVGKQSRRLCDKIVRSLFLSRLQRTCFCLRSHHHLQSHCGQKISAKPIVHTGHNIYVLPKKNTNVTVSGPSHFPFRTFLPRPSPTWPPSATPPPQCLPWPPFCLRRPRPPRG